MVTEGQLRIERKGKVVKFVDRQGNRAWYAQITWLRSLCYGERKFYYADRCDYESRGEYKPYERERAV